MKAVLTILVFISSMGFAQSQNETGITQEGSTISVSQDLWLKGVEAYVNCVTEAKIRGKLNAEMEQFCRALEMRTKNNNQKTEMI